jgi:hypothetical protein
MAGSNEECVSNGDASLNERRCKVSLYFSPAPAAPMYVD